MLTKILANNLLELEEFLKDKEIVLTVVGKKIVTHRFTSFEIFKQEICVLEKWGVTFTINQLSNQYITKSAYHKKDFDKWARIGKWTHVHITASF